MVIRDRKRLQARLKRKKNHVVVMFVCMNEVKHSYIRRMNERSQQNLCLSVRWKNLRQISSYSYL